MDNLRDDHLEFLKRAQAATKLSVNALAGKAQVTPSALSKFVSGHTRHMNRQTIARIAEFSRVELPTMGGFTEGDAAPYLKKIPENLDINDFDGDKFEMLVNTKSMDLENILPEDLLIFERTQNPDYGEVVCAQHYNSKLATAETIIRIYSPPYLIARSTEMKHSEPILINKDVNISGRLLRQVRVRNFRKVS